MNCGPSSSEERTLSTSQEIVVYCVGVYCATSIRLYSLLQRDGYTRVRRDAGSLGEMGSRGLPDPKRPRQVAERSRAFLAPPPA
jgi:hypothetical protein